MRLTRRKFVERLASAACATGVVRPLAARQDAPTGPRTAPPRIDSPGRYRLDLELARDGLIYAPRGYVAGVDLPLLLWLHGAGGSAASAEAWFPLADEHGVIVLAPDSREWTWDALIGGFGPDVSFLLRALASTVARCAVDRRRLALGGFSDGASYALSLGIGNGDVFGHLIAGSPGVMQPAAVVGKPRIFISHGTADTVMPIEETSRTFVRRLEALRYDVTYREYDGRHTWPPEVRREALEWFLQGG